MNCYYHADVPAIGTCTICGKAICEQDAVEVQGKLVCRQDLAEGKAITPVGNVERSPKDRSVALILEILPGLFGFLGFGWIYSGNTSTGIMWLVGLLVWDVMAFIIIALTGGLGFICTVPISIVIIALSASSLNTYSKHHPELFGP